MLEPRGQKLDVRGEKLEVRAEKREVRGEMSEVRNNWLMLLYSLMVLMAAVEDVQKDIVIGEEHLISLPKRIMKGSEQALVTLKIRCH